MAATRDENAEIRQGLWDRLKEKLNRYQRAAKDGASNPDLDRYAERARALFENVGIRDWVFAPVKQVFRPGGPITSTKVYETITGVALANAVMAGLPGKLGVGVVVSMALEAYMALRIAQHVGLTHVRTPQDALRLLGALAGTVLVIGLLFKEMLGVAFSAFNLIGAIPATFAAELAVTNLVGILLWTGFREMGEDRAFRIPARTLKSAGAEWLSLTKHQLSILKGVVNPRALRSIGKRLKAWMTGEAVVPTRRVRDEAFVAAAMAAVVGSRGVGLDGPVGKEFLQSIRDLYPDLAGASTGEISAHFSAYEEEQIGGILSQLKGRLHERLVVAAENTDGDTWIARLQEDVFNPSTDMILTNVDTGEEFAVSLKATDSPSYVEHALSRYPQDPVFVTEEAAAGFEDGEGVSSSGISNEHLEEVTGDNFDRLVQGLEPSRLDIAGGAASGVALAGAAALWPFVSAWMQGRISREQLEAASARVLGQSGKNLVGRLAAGLVLGPIYMWYLLARTVFALSGAAHATGGGGTSGSEAAS